MTDLEAYVRQLTAFAYNPISERALYDVQETYRRLGAERNQLASEAASLLNSLANKIAREPLAPLVPEAPAERWDASEDGWEYQQFDTEKTSQKIRRMAVPSGWLYQVEMMNFEEPRSAEVGKSLQGWHPPVFVPAPTPAPEAKTRPIPSRYTTKPPGF